MILLLAMLLPAIARAHAGEPLEPHDLWTAWRFDAGVVIPLALTALLYARGSRLERGARRLRRVYFWSGWGTLVVALLSPLHPLGEALFSAHMAQHEILMLAAAPLLVLSRPLVPMLWGLPFTWRRAVGRWSKTRPMQRAWRAITRPAAAWAIHAVALWAWHAPVLFQATLTSDWAHAAQHASFLFSALLFWWSLWFSHGRAGYGAGVVSLFTTGAHTGILGALLTLSPAVWYPAYGGSMAAWGLTSLQDQQLGGLIMWVPAGLVYLAAGLALCAAWMRESDRMIAGSNARRASLLAVTIGMTMLLTRCAPPSPASVRGKAAIARYGCGICHTIGGIPGAHGLVGPPLNTLPQRMYIAGVLPNNPDNFVRWVKDPKAVDEKTAMPRLDLTEADVRDIAAYIYSKQ